MGYLKSLETKSLARLSRVTMKDQFIYPISVRVSGVNEQAIESFVANSKGQMLDVIAYIAQVILEEDQQIEILAERLNLSSISKPDVYLN